MAQENPCPQGESYLHKNSNLQNEGPRELKSVVVTLAEAQAYFDAIKRPEHNIPFQYVLNGCDMRALFASKILKESYNADTFRVALEVENYQKLYRRTSYTQEGEVEFDRHTATALCVFNPQTQVTSPYVIDPAFFNQVVPLQEWKNGFTKNGEVPTRSYFASMYSLNPQVHRSRFHNGELREAEDQRRFHISEVNYMLRSGERPYGVGSAYGQFETRDILNQGAE